MDLERLLSLWGSGVLIEAFASGKGTLYVNDLYVNNPPAIEGASANPVGDTFLGCALEIKAECVVSGDSDLVEIRSYMVIPILMLRAFLKHFGEVPGRQPPCGKRGKRDR